MLLAAVRENNDAEPPLRDEPDIDRGAWQPAVLVDDGEVAGADDLPGEALPEARFDGEHVLLGQGHGILDRALVGKLADMGDQERGHVAGRG
jgi:hypothetical protein